jgi:Tfp pilus assembly protein PilX
MGRPEMAFKLLREERGIALVIAIMLLLVVTAIGMGAVNTAIFENMIARNKRVSDQAFYVAEAGINEFLGRFQADALGQITDSAPNNSDWRLYLAINIQRASEIGYNSSNPSHSFVSSLPSVQQVEPGFAVEVRHKVNSANQVVFSGNSPLYIAKSYGFTADGGNKVIEVEFRRGPSYDPPAALYTEAPSDILGSSTYIQGLDQCGQRHKPGILTTLPKLDSRGKLNIDISGNPTISGTPTNPDLNNYSIIFNEPNTRSIEDMINYLKNYANFSYAYNSNETITGNRVSGVLQNWADPGFPPANYSTTTPLSYDGKMNIVYFNMKDSQNNYREIKLAGGCYGAGILLIDGDLEINGGFAWYGVIIVRGALKYTGGGNKNITGGVMAGESVGVDVDVGGNAGIIYCSRATDQASGGVPSYKIVRWQEIF